MLIIGRALTVIVALFLAFDGVIHVMHIAPVVKAFAHLEFPAGIGLALGIIELACLALYCIPNTSVLGAVLLTGYLGGAVASHVRVEDPVFSTVLFPVYVGILLWAGVFFRNEKLREVFPFNKE